MIAEDKIIEELDALPVEKKEYIKEVLDKMLREARREEIYQNAEESRRELREGKTKTVESVNDLMNSLDED